MKFQPTNQSGSYVGLEDRLRTTRILWVLSVMTTGLYALCSAIVLKANYDLKAGGYDNPSLLSTLTAASLVSVSVSFVVRRRFHMRAVKLLDPALMQKGFVLAAILCALPGVFALCGLTFTFNLGAYLLFALGALGQALHFPRRDQLAAAYWRGF